ncbi:MAG: histidine kinase dimerization/phospho-acceptor domain-containing protein [Firmicutes bacterium]|nr:histidine kinase dimerization/phospho-acceptor domain-containing protein [Bacillota bacterium]
MRYNIAFKFLAVALCALMLLTAAASGLGIVALMEQGLFDKTVAELREEEIQSHGQYFAIQTATHYAESQLGGWPAELEEPDWQYGWGNRWGGWFYGSFDPEASGYVLKDAEDNVLERDGAERLSNASTYSFPVSGSYRYVLSVEPKQEPVPETTAEGILNFIPEGGEMGVYRVSIDYESGSESASGGADPIGYIQSVDGTVVFTASEPGMVNLPSAPVQAVTFWDENDNILYQAENVASDCFSLDPEGRFTFDSSGQLLTDGTERNSVPSDGADTAPAEETAPQEASGSSVYDDIPDDNTAVYGASFFLRLENGENQSIGCFGTEKPVGVLTRNDAEVLFLRFRADSAFYQDNFPADAVITEVEFRGEEDTVLYRAENPEGVGEFDWSTDGTATSFRVSPAVEARAMTAQTPSDETTPVETQTGETLPGETVPAETEPEVVTDTPVPSTDPEGPVFTDDELRTTEYWDTETQQAMVVTYRLALMPDYTLELTVAPGGYRYDYAYPVLELLQTYRNYLFAALGISLLLFAVLAVYLCCAAGRKPGREETRAGGFNCICLDVYFAAGAVLIVGLGALIEEYADDLFRLNLQTAFAGVLGAGYLACLIFVGFCFACAAQFKTPGGYWWRNLLCWRLLNLLVKCAHGFFTGCGWLCRKLPKGFAVLRGWALALLGLLKRLWLWLWGLVKKAAGKVGKTVNRFYSLMPLTWQWMLTGFTMVLLLFVAIATRSEGMLVLCLMACVAVVLYGAYCFGTLLESAKRMSKGDLDTKVDEKYLSGAFRDFAGELNDLAGVAVVAAQKQLKSERMKTELITNVSHDIKTPLTSIINYVDLLQKPHTPEEEKTYLEVLNRQSQRLKKLIDDLMEMSKASTGNLTVDITKLDAAEAVNQALGEFSDKLDKAQLTPIFRRPEEPVAVMADGRLLWRVLSNLLSNAVKYALPGTRLYIDLMALEGKVVISLKNISREELNVDADELMERFVRGDDSRNTEGSGLGLNIAKTLMELQKGQLQLLVDGDLFKVTLIFPGA